MSPKAIATRLRLLADALDETHAEMALMSGITTRSGWSNYIMANRIPRITHAITLCERTGVTLDWIYRGLYASAVVPDLRRKLLIAQTIK